MTTEIQLIQVPFILINSLFAGFTTSIGLGSGYYKLKWFFSSNNEEPYLYALDLYSYRGVDNHILYEKLFSSLKFYFLLVLTIIFWFVLITTMVTQGLILKVGG